MWFTNHIIPLLSGTKFGHSHILSVHISSTMSLIVPRPRTSIPIVLPLSTVFIRQSTVGAASQASCHVFPQTPQMSTSETKDPNDSSSNRQELDETRGEKVCAEKEQRVAKLVNSVIFDSSWRLKYGNDLTVLTGNFGTLIM